MAVETLVFYLFAALLVGAASMVIFVRNPVYAALYLVLAFFSSAAIWMLLEAEFLAIGLVLVYVGAVMVLFLFVVMMLDINLSPLKEGFTRYLPVGLLIAVALAVELVVIIWYRANVGTDTFPVPAPNPEGYSNTEALGELLFTEYLWPFEIAAMILLVAIVAAIALTLRQAPQGKRQDPSRQVQVRREERVRMVKMTAETQTRDGGEN